MFSLERLLLRWDYLLILAKKFLCYGTVISLHLLPLRPFAMINESFLSLWHLGVCCAEDQPP